MMEPLSPGLVGADPKSVYAFTNAAHATEEGNAWSDDAPGSNATLVAPGYVASVHRQPATGGVVVSVNPDGSGYRVDTPALPQLNSGNITDSFAWKATKAGSPDIGPFSVPLEIVNAG